MSKKKLVIEYKKVHPDKGPTEISRELGIKVTTVKAALNTLATQLFYEMYQRKVPDTPPLEEVELTINIRGGSMTYKKVDIIEDDYDDDDVMSDPKTK